MGKLFKDFTTEVIMDEEKVDVMVNTDGFVIEKFSVWSETFEAWILADISDLQTSHEEAYLKLHNNVHRELDQMGVWEDGY